MIIVEGPDGAGKTTLLRQLQEDLELEIAPRVVSKDAQAMVDLKQWVVNNTLKGWQPLLFDRHRLVSELIYGPILRPATPEPGFNDLAWLHEAMNRFRGCEPTIIYCLPPWPVVWSHVEQDEDNRLFHTKKHKYALQQIYWLYHNKIAMDMSRYPSTTYVYDYTAQFASLKYASILSRVQREIDRKKRH